MKGKPPSIHIIDMKRAHNVSIQLSSLRKPLSDIYKAVLEMDYDFLTNEVLHVLHRTLPTKDDVALLRQYKGDLSQLAEVEKYYLNLMNICRIEERIQILSFKRQSFHIMQQIEEELRLLQLACYQLKHCDKFVKLLETVLAIGNHLNSDSSRGAAKGFKIDALLKLMDVKGCNGKTTLLHFVLTELSRTDEQILNLSEELKDVKAAAALKLDTIFSHMEEMNHGMEMVRKELEKTDTDVGDNSNFTQQFLELIRPFYKELASKISKLKTLMETSLKQLQEVTAYFGEIVEEHEQMELFHTVREFLCMFDHAKKEVKTQKRKEEGISRPLYSPRKEVEDRCQYENASPRMQISIKRPDKFSNVNFSGEAKALTEIFTRRLLTQSERFLMQNGGQCAGGGYDSDWSTG